MNGRTNVTGSTNVETTEVALDAPSNPVADSFDAKVELMWTDPLNKYAVPENGTATDPYPIIAQWHHTSIVRKENSDPTSINDGILVTESTVKNQYQSSGYFDTSLVNDTEYHYGLFAVTDRGIVSAPAIVTCTPTAGTPIRELAEGTVIKILENGSPVEFYLAKHNYEPELNREGRELVVRSSFAGRGMWQNAATNYTYSGHQIDQWCQSYVNRFSQTVKSLISTTKFYEQRAEWASQVNQLERPAFPLSINELNLATSSGTSEGSPLPIASTLLAGAMRNCWTRSIYTFAGRYSVYFINSSGNLDDYRGDQIQDYLPAFTLPSTAAVNDNMELIEKIS